VSDFFAHATSTVDAGAVVGGGTKIWHYSHIYGSATIGADCSIGQNVMVGPGVSVGRGVKIQNNVAVYEGVTLEDYVFCGPSMVFTNVRTPRSEFPRNTSDDYADTLVKRGASIGANATIVCGVTLHECAFVAAGAVVTKDVGPYVMVAGVPARPIGFMSAYGDVLDFSVQATAVDSAGHRYELRDGQCYRLTDES
jgi:UDP-2-acetamido-3-amino-2,3-dideoxy-glucuronate N-acetyltransferase